jgi:uncharacterized protein involved in exopolysaccharide biosynthesis
MNQTPQHEIYEDEPNLLDYWRVLVKHKRLIGLTVCATVVTSVIVSLLLPKIYASTASILPPRQEAGNIAFQLPGGLDGLGGDYLGIESPVNLWMGILKSRTIKDAVITRLDLINVLEKENLEDARGALNTMVMFKKSKEKIISITVESRDPELAADLANAFIEELDQLITEHVMTSGKRKRVFVEKRLVEAKASLGEAEEAVRAFKEKNRAVKLDSQAETIFEAIGTVKGQLMAKEVELQTLLSYATQNYPRAEILKTEVEELKERLRELEEGKKGSSNPHQKDVFIPTVRMPDLSLRYARLLRDAKVQETLYEFLIQQYEVARIEEVKDTPTVEVLDRAVIPEKRAKPRRKFIVVFSTVFAFFIAVFLSFFMEYIEKMQGAISTNSDGYGDKQ